MVKGSGRQLKQGLYREYVNCQNDLTTKRNKLDVQGTIKNQLARKQWLSREIDEFSENTTLNQILKTTAYLLLRQGDAEKEYKNTLKKKMMYFSIIDTLSPLEIKWSQLRLLRNNSAYHPCDCEEYIIGNKSECPREKY